MPLGINLLRNLECLENYNNHRKNGLEENEKKKNEKNKQKENRNDKSTYKQDKGKYDRHKKDKIEPILKKLYERAAEVL